MVPQILLIFWLLVSCPPHHAQQQESAQELSTVPGTVDVADGSPVSLSDVRKVLLKPQLGPDGVSEIVIRTDTEKAALPTTARAWDRTICWQKSPPAEHFLTAA